jgi:hypothetical protein
MNIPKPDAWIKLKSVYKPTVTIRTKLVRLKILSHGSKNDSDCQALISLLKRFELTRDGLAFLFT